MNFFKATPSYRSSPEAPIPMLVDYVCEQLMHIKQINEIRTSGGNHFPDVTNEGYIEIKLPDSLLSNIKERIYRAIGQTIQNLQTLKYSLSKEKIAAYLNELKKQINRLPNKKIGSELCSAINNEIQKLVQAVSGLSITQANKGKMQPRTTHHMVEDLKKAELNAQQILQDLTERLCRDITKDSITDKTQAPTVWQYDIVREWAATEILVNKNRPSITLPDADQPVVIMTQYNVLINFLQTQGFTPSRAITLAQLGVQSNLQGFGSAVGGLLNEYNLFIDTNSATYSFTGNNDHLEFLTTFKMYSRNTNTGEKTEAAYIAITVQLSWLDPDISLPIISNVKLDIQPKPVLLTDNTIIYLPALIDQIFPAPAQIERFIAAYNFSMIQSKNFQNIVFSNLNLPKLHEKIEGQFNNFQDQAVLDPAFKPLFTVLGYKTNGALFSDLGALNKALGLDDIAFKEFEQGYIATCGTQLFNTEAERQAGKIVYAANDLALVIHSMLSLKSKLSNYFKNWSIVDSDLVRAQFSKLPQILQNKDLGQIQTLISKNPKIKMYCEIWCQDLVNIFHKYLIKNNNMLYLEKLLRAIEKCKKDQRTVSLHSSETSSGVGLSFDDSASTNSWPYNNSAPPTTRDRAGTV